MQTVGHAPLDESVSFGRSSGLGHGLVFSSQALILLLLLFPLVAAHAVLHLSLDVLLLPGQHEDHLCIHGLAGVERVAHSFDQADDCAQNCKHRPHQVDPQQTTAGLLAPHLFDEGDQLLHVLHFHWLLLQLRIKKCEIS